jgi:hypothetical protein
VVEPSPPTPAGPPPQPPAPLAFGFDEQQRPVAFEVRTGMVASRAAPPDAGVSFRDLVFDSRHRRLWLFESDAEELSGSVTAIAFGAPKPFLGARQPRAWLDGLAFLWPLHDGVVVFENGYGTRWRFLPDDGQWLPSQPAPLPAAIWGSSDEAGTWLDGIAYPATPLGALRRVSAASSDGSLGPVEISASDVHASTMPSSALAVPAFASGDALLVDVLANGAGVGLRRRDGDQWQAPQVLPLPFDVSSLREVRGMSRAAPAADRERLAVFVEQPPHVGVIDWPLGDGPDSVATSAWYPVDAPTGRPDWAVSRELLVVGHDRVLVATAGGVLAFRFVEATPSSPARLVREVAFVGDSLRGPLAGPAVL